MFSPKQSENEGSSLEISKEEIEPVLDIEPPLNNISRKNSPLRTRAGKRQNKTFSCRPIFSAIFTMIGMGAFVYLIYHLASHLVAHKARPKAPLHLTTHLKSWHATIEEDRETDKNNTTMALNNHSNQTLSNDWDKKDIIAKLLRHLENMQDDAIVEQIFNHALIAALIQFLCFFKVIASNFIDCIRRSTCNKEDSLEEAEPPMQLKDLMLQEEGLMKQRPSSRNL